ncbi:glutathione S-transferase [Candidimonas sp. SYP-B2681]|uniref:glutathione S-transferase n=1 Tax=Candidimonas sp. SYP-B2681 TaxID=2497686 RepID=UPI000F8972DE|nr:glutathione S-transferase [Candidimonas sp. SYP-B2681]RTZ39968.1 glutathione S-transferase [Candidimonas sp. SYP-B2681]
MTTQTYPVLYSFRRCPYAMRARSAIVVSGQVCELREVVLRNKPQALLDASPKASVPVLVNVAGRVIDQSLDIMLWALERNDPLAWLRPAQGDLTGMLKLIGECDDEFKFHLDRYKYPQRYENVDGQEHRAEAGRWLEQLESRLATHRFLFGDRMGLADAAIAPFVRQFAHTDLEWFARQSWPHLQAWLLQWSESSLFDRIMDKYPPWEPGASIVVFPDPSSRLAEIAQ